MWRVREADIEPALGHVERRDNQRHALRSAIDNTIHGAELEQLVKKYTRAGWEIGGDVLKTAPRGWSPEHPRIELLRHKSLTIARDYGFDEVIHSGALVRQVRKDWRTGTPLIDWVCRHG